MIVRRFLKGESKIHAQAQHRSKLGCDYSLSQLLCAVEKNHFQRKVRSLAAVPMSQPLKTDSHRPRMATAASRAEVR